MASLQPNTNTMNTDPDWKRFDAIVLDYQQAYACAAGYDISRRDARNSLLDIVDVDGVADQLDMLPADIRYAQWCVKPRSKRQG